MPAIERGQEIRIGDYCSGNNWRVLELDVLRHRLDEFLRREDLIWRKELLEQIEVRKRVGTFLSEISTCFLQNE
jgi:hypothetical protein